MKAGKRTTIIGISVTNQIKTIHDFDGEHKKVSGYIDITCPTTGSLFRFPYSSNTECKKVIQIRKEIKEEGLRLAA